MGSLRDFSGDVAGWVAELDAAEQAAADAVALFEQVEAERDKNAADLAVSEKERADLGALVQQLRDRIAELEGGNPDPDPDPDPEPDPDPDPEPERTKPIVGVGGGSQAVHFDPLDRETGPMQARRSYDGAIPSTFARSQAASDVAAKRVSLWSCKPGSDFHTNTTKQQAFSQFLDSIPAGHRVRVMIHHEPENDFTTLTDIQRWGAWQDTGARIVRSKNRPELTFGPCFMSSWTWDSRSPYFQWKDAWGTVMDWSQFDFVGLDVYRTKVEDKYSMEALLTVKNSGDGTSLAGQLSVFDWLKKYGGDKLPITFPEVGMYTKQPDGHKQSDPPVNPHPEDRIVAWTSQAWEWAKKWNRDNPSRPILDFIWYSYSLIGAETPIDRPMSALNGPTVYLKKTANWKLIVADSKTP